MQIKQLKQGSQLIVPQTTAEAVLVKTSETVLRLDTALSLKSGLIITPDNSGLSKTVQNDTVILTHSNVVEPTDSEKPIMIKYDSHGHITGSKLLLPLNIIVNNKELISHSGGTENNLKFGDDFTTDQDDNIKLNWNNL